MSAAAASATERDDLQIIQALQGVEKGRWWNIASYAPGTCSLARLIGCPQERFNAFVRGHKLGGYNKGSTTRTLTVEDITLTVIKSDGNTGYRARKHNIRENKWWAFGTVPTEPAKWYYYEDQKHANEGAAGSDAAAEGGVIPGGRGGDASSSSLSSSSSYGSSSSLSSAKWFLDNKPDETPGDGGVGGGAAAAHAASSSSSGGDDDDDDDDDGDSPLSSPSPAEGVYEGVYVTRANVHLVRCGTHLSVWWAGSNGFGGGYELGVVTMSTPRCRGSESPTPARRCGTTSTC